MKVFKRSVINAQTVAQMVGRKTGKVIARSVGRLSSPNRLGRGMLATLALTTQLSLAGFVPGIVNAAQSTGQSSSHTILVLGDSLSAEYGIRRGTGWVSLLQARLAIEGGKYRTVNASISGETTAGGRSRIQSLLNRHQPAAVILALGANDALRGLDLDSTYRNLSAISGAARASGAKLLVLGMEVPPNYGQAYVTRFSELFVQVASKHDAQLVPFLLAPIATDMSYFQADGIHPTRQAQPLLLDVVWPKLKFLLD